MSLEKQIWADVVKRLADHAKRVCSAAKAKGLACDFSIDDSSPEYAIAFIDMGPRSGGQSVHVRTSVTLEREPKGAWWFYAYATAYDPAYGESVMADDYSETPAVRSIEELGEAWKTFEAIAEPAGIVDTVMRSMRGRGHGRIDVVRVKRRLMR